MRCHGRAAAHVILRRIFGTEDSQSPWGAAGLRWVHLATELTDLIQLHSAPIRSSATSLPPCDSERRRGLPRTRECEIFPRLLSTVESTSLHPGTEGRFSPDLRRCDRRFLNIKSCNSPTRHGSLFSLGGPRLGGLAARIHVAAVPRKRRSMMECGRELELVESPAAWTCTLNEELQMARS
jgi:hypothetical protein